MSAATVTDPAPCFSYSAVKIARLLLYKEHWYGTAESTSGSIIRKSRLLDRQSDVPANGSSSSPTDSCGGSSNKSSRVLQLLPSHKFDVPVVSMRRPQPAQLAGSWNVFQVSAVPVLEEDPDTLQVNRSAGASGVRHQHRRV